MDNRVVQFRIGVLVLASIVLAVALVLLFGDLPSWLGSSYTIYVHVADARGVQPGTPVRKSGVLIGRVTEIDFAEQGGVRLTLQIDGKVKLHRDETCQIRTSLLGDAEVDFVPAQ
jgi:phospholipid/cholesterol/gamma-HCH transport system substrate-binding protein